MTRTTGAFLFPARWEPLARADARKLFMALKNFGVNTIVTESSTYRADLIDLAHDLDLQFVGGVACFSGHEDGNQAVRERPALWPVLENGEHRPTMEWYVGVTPTFADYRESRLDLIETVANRYALDGLILDFIRWPMHWELELRPNAPPPLENSFDAHTLAQFSAYANLELPTEPTATAALAQWIRREHRDVWTAFKCQVITDFVREARERVGKMKLGVYLVPAPETEREALLGQRLVDLAPLVEYVCPMMYHTMLHQTADWLLTTTRELAQQLPGKLLPVLQVDSAEGADFNADWGPPMPAAEWQQVACGVLAQEGVSGITAFTGTALFHEDRGRRLRICAGEAFV